LEVRREAEDVTRVGVPDLFPPWRAWLVTAGCEAQGKAQGRPFRPGVTGEGKAGRVNDAESLLMPRQSDSPGRMEATGVVGAGRWKAAGGDRGRPDGRGNTVAPGVKRTPDPAVSHACGTWKPRQGPVGLPGRRRSADRKGSPVPAGNRTPKKRTPAAERQRESGSAGPVLQPDALRITGRIPGLVPGCESRLTCGG
jgi:hypothetical protein